MSNIEMNDWIALHSDDLESGWNEWANKMTDVFFDFIAFCEYCYENRHLSPVEWRKKLNRMHRGVGRRAVA